MMNTPVKILMSCDGVLGVAFVSNSSIVTDPGATTFPQRVSCLLVQKLYYETISSLIWINALLILICNVSAKICIRMTMSWVRASYSPSLHHQCNGLLSQ